MNDAAAFAGSYADFKFVKTRSVCQVIVELPIEQADAFLLVFKAPQPGKERPVALALLDPGSSNGRTSDLGSDNGGSTPSPGAKKERPQRCPTSGRPDRVTQWFGIACGEPRFQAWCREHFGMSAEVDREVAAELVRGYCGVKSRGEFATDPEARQKALDLMEDYSRAMGEATEDRS